MDLDTDETKEEIDAEEQDDLRPEYEETELAEMLANGVRGKYVKRYPDEILKRTNLSMVKLLLVSLFFLGLNSTVLYAQPKPVPLSVKSQPPHHYSLVYFGKDSLKGLKIFAVTVILMGDPDVKVLPVLNVMKNDLQTKFELKLREAGIIIADTNTSGGDGALLLQVDLIGSEDGRTAICTTMLQAQQMLLFPNDPKSAVLATTWVQKSGGGKSNIEASYVSQLVEDMAGKFANDYLAANPPTPARSSPK